jgi:plastocyanin
MRRAPAVLAGLLLVTACSPSDKEPTSEADTVQLKLLQFTPGRLTIPVGTEVTWRNAEPITHTVTSGAVTGVDEKTGLRSGQQPDGRFDHRLERSGQAFSYTFSEPGTYSYFCSIHQGMNATVVVTA